MASEVIVMGNEYAIHKLNGEIVNIITDLKHDSGLISLQAETAEIFYKNLEMMGFSKSLPITDFVSKEEL